MLVCRAGCDFDLCRECPREGPVRRREILNSIRIRNLCNCEDTPRNYNISFGNSPSFRLHVCLQRNLHSTLYPRAHFTRASRAHFPAPAHKNPSFFLHVLQHRKKPSFFLPSPHVRAYFLLHRPPPNRRPEQRRGLNTSGDGTLRLRWWEQSWTCYTVGGTCSIGDSP
jgi:hypothetical protein